MPLPATRAPELAIPVVSLGALRKALVAEVGANAAAQALRAAGHAAGDAWYPQFAAGKRGDDVPEKTFWQRLSKFFHAHGWGTLTHNDAHPGVGALEATDWVEAVPDAGEARPSCFFTTGVLANLLGNVAGTGVAVLEVECRSTGDDRCRFMFGSPEALNALYSRVASGSDVNAALSEL
jgi:predicted hydrocarbon binding protein